ncbi:1-phosphofructokinase family hexose kinase [Streptococcus suis]|uniref:1-phosphofructokinase family hexose kinase n=1 Tax=Streptococcus suis TaxID=1307 RepID=UPI0005CDB397|nr:1-phosphofructokinase family hexose kinase [Streptococcus suis]NQH64272.1 1-phosphofructokinase family hexose kinase [Streptococcus suis]CYU92914.1 tagatose-6-phosphate kinase [Streptococcus suis]
MVLIVTLNPSVDLLYFEPQFILGKHNRFNSSTIMAAGKGINCSRALSHLGISATSLALVGGKTGEFFKQHLADENFQSLYIPVEDETRHSITVMHNQGTHTEIVEAGPKVSSELKTSIFNRILDIAKQEKPSIISLNGSVHSDDPYFYNELITLLREELDYPVTIVTDFSRQALYNIVHKALHKPDFIKPNIHEFSELVGQELSSKEEVLSHLLTTPSPIPYTLVSCGEQGAIAQFNGQLYDVTAPTIDLVNPTGSGDASVAGAIYAFANKLDDENIIRYAIASGTANAMENGVGIAPKEIVHRLLDQVTIRPIAHDN